MNNIKLINDDCMNVMKDYENNYFDLAIVDPPYGIGAGSKSFINRNTANKNAEKIYRDNDWDFAPNKNYFNELNRVSKKYIIWGGNYFTNFLEPARCYIVWDKKTGNNSYADCELALTNINANAKVFTKSWIGANANNGTPRIHPTEKPIKLYEWLLKNYSKKEDKILDTHLGSGSSAIASYYFGVKEFVGIELDKEYFEAMNKRFKEQTKQIKLF